MKKYTIIFSLMLGLISCEHKTELLKIEDYSINFPSSYVNDVKKMSIEYETASSDNRKLIIFNQPFNLPDDYEMVILFNNKLVYKYSENKLKIPSILKDKDNISTKIVIISKGNCYAFENKEVFLYSPNDTFYYLSFYPTNKNEVPYSIIPSSTIIQ